jgi:hypothetical protein
MDKSFLLLFFKKEALAFFPPSRLQFLAGVDTIEHGRVAAQLYSV